MPIWVSNKVSVLKVSVSRVAFATEKEVLANSYFSKLTDQQNLTDQHAKKNMLWFITLITIIIIFYVLNFLSEMLNHIILLNEESDQLTTLFTIILVSFIIQGGPKKTLLLSGFEFLNLGEVFLGVVFHQKLIGDVLWCPTCGKRMFFGP